MSKENPTLFSSYNITCRYDRFYIHDIKYIYTIHDSGYQKNSFEIEKRYEYEKSSSGKVEAEKGGWRRRKTLWVYESVRACCEKIYIKSISSTFFLSLLLLRRWTIRLSRLVSFSFARALFTTRRRQKLHAAGGRL